MPSSSARLGKFEMILPAQIKAARALLGLGQTDLSELAGIGIATVKRIEAVPQVRGSASSLWKIQTALEAAGIEFIPADERRGPGVRLKAAPRRTPKRTAKRT